MGLRPEFDLRDNLQHALTATGTYEPAVVEAALGAEPGTARAARRPAYDPADAGVRSLHGSGPLGQDVEITTFDIWAAAHRVERLDLVKLDVEGAELAALHGVAGALTRLRPSALPVEVKDRVLNRAGVAGHEVRELLERLGYQPAGQALPVANELYRPGDNG